MFKRVFQSLSKTFTGRDESSPAEPASRKAKSPATPAPEKTGSLLNKLSDALAPAEKKKGSKALVPSVSPEELCGVTPSMNKDQIRKQLALLYRRHNRATSSLDAKMRAEAEKMLTAVVAVREKHFGPV